MMKIDKVLRYFLCHSNEKDEFLTLCFKKFEYSIVLTVNNKSRYVLSHIE